MNVKRTTSYLLSFQGYPPILEAIRRKHRHRRICRQQVQLKSKVTNLLHEGGANQPQKPKKSKRDDSRDSVDRLRDLPEWLEEFTDNLEDTDVPAPAHFSGLRFGKSHEGGIKSKTRKHSIDSQLPKYRNCEVCRRTKVTTVLCRRRTGEGLLRAEKFGDLLTADHKVFNEESESRNNHRYAVVGQDLATQWFQSYPCKTDFTRDGKVCVKVLGAVTQATSYLYTQCIGIWQIL